MIHTTSVDINPYKITVTNRNEPVDDGSKCVGKMVMYRIQLRNKFSKLRETHILADYLHISSFRKVQFRVQGLS